MKQNQTKTALITGSTSGIGLGIAKVYAANKYNLVIHGFSDKGETLAKSIATEYGVECFFNGTNLNTPTGAKNLVQFAIEKLGTLDVLINNAGLQFVSPIEDFPDEKWQEIINVNLSAAFYAIKSVWPTMKQNKFGRIINIASVHGLVASEFKSAYITSKHGIIGLTKSIALEGAPLGITCNAICPGYVKTPLVEGQIKDQAKAHNISEADVVKNIMLAKHVIKEFVTPEAIATMCLLLSGNEGALITGTSLTIDGGWTAQ